jgi:molecular chaperone GrpE (heat shock protein)
MVKFQSVARQIRSFSQHESEVKVLEKEIEELVENLLKVQEDQQQIRNIFHKFRRKIENTAK